MCRITGLWNRKSSNCDKNSILKMRDCLSYGGPDDAGIYYEDNGLHLAHRRLSILDLTNAGHQPYIWDRYVLVFNGEIYNFKEINKELKEYKFSSFSDTETIVKAWDKWGPKAISKFRGMFSFVLYDKRDKKLFLVRDRLGVKPLYYSVNRDLLLFGSELKALMQHESLDKSIDKHSLALYFQQGYIPSPNSIFKSVKKIKPGHYLMINGDLDVIESEYWSATEAYKDGGLPEYKNNSEDDWKAIIHQELKTSFAYRMVADVPVGMFLSGGVDSSLVSAMLQKESNKQLKTFTIGFHDENYNEAPFAREVADHIGTEHHELIVDEEDFKKLLPEIPRLFDEPNGDSSIIPTHLVSKFAKEHVKVSLSADGGDELFGGYTKYEITQNLYPKLSRIPSIAKKGLYQILHHSDPNTIDKYSSKIPALRNYKNLGPKLLKFKNGLSAPSQVEFFNMASSFLSKEEVHRLVGLSPRRIWWDMPEKDDSRSISYWGLIDAKTYMEGDIMTKVDRATMHAALEGREPLLDHRLFELAMAVPDTLKIRGNTTKYLLREILYDYVPRELIERPKQGFAIPIEKWLKGDLKKRVISIEEDEKFLSYFDLDHNAVKSHIKLFYDKNINPQIVWYFFILHQWYEEWILK